MTPSIGRTVHYRLSSLEADQINARRADTTRNLDIMRTERPGFQAHVGSLVVEGDTASMVVTRVHATGDISGQATLDGNDSLWVISAIEGDAPGQWSWPPRGD